MALVALAGAAAASLYLDGKFHVRKDLNGLYMTNKAQREWDRATTEDRVSLWYSFERQVQSLPSLQECIWSRTGCYTWQETYDQACRYAQELLSLGVQTRELVAVYMQNSPEFMFATLSTWAVGSAPAYINYNLAGDALIHCLKVSGAKLLLVDAEHSCRSRIEESREKIENELGMKIVILDDSWKAAIASTAPQRPEDRHRAGITSDFPMSLFYTSGTTGLPKACNFPIIRTLGIGSYRHKFMGFPDAPNGVRWYNCMPLYHGTGSTVACGSMISGATLCIGKKFSTSRFWDDIRDSRATAFVYVGETARYLLSAPESPKDRDHSVRAIFGNGLRPDIWRRFRDRFGIEVIYEFFSSSEGVFGLQNICRGEYTAGAVGHHGAILRLLHHKLYVPVRIDHDTGDIWRHPKTGFAARESYEEGGEMLVKVEDTSAFVGYWNNQDATAKKFARDVFQKGDLYYRSGDALRRTSDGKWFFLDRLGDTFRWKGENCSTAEIAECLGQFPGILEANVYGVELPAHDGRAGCAAIYVSPEDRKLLDFKQLLAHSRKMLPSYAVPLFLRLVADMAPTMHNNKQNKVQLRREGVDLQKIANGEGGRQDVVFWLPPGSDTYVPFGEQEWNRLVTGKARL